MWTIERTQRCSGLLLLLLALRLRLMLHLRLLHVRQDGRLDRPCGALLSLRAHASGWLSSSHRASILLLHLAPLASRLSQLHGGCMVSLPHLHPHLLQHRALLRVQAVGTPGGAGVERAQGGRRARRGGVAAGGSGQARAGAGAAAKSRRGSSDRGRPEGASDGQQRRSGGSRSGSRGSGTGLLRALLRRGRVGLAAVRAGVPLGQVGRARNAAPIPGLLVASGLRAKPVSASRSRRQQQQQQQPYSQRSESQTGKQCDSGRCSACVGRVLTIL